MILFLSNTNLFSQEIYENNKFINSGKIWDEADIGKIIDKNDLIIEKIFENNIGNKIFYMGRKIMVTEYFMFNIMEIEQ